MDIHTLIKSRAFSVADVERALHGECMWFAMALQDVLEKEQTSTDLVVAAKTGNDEDQFSHVLVRHQLLYFDIRGHVLAEQVHATYGTHCIRDRSREKIMNDYGWMGDLCNERIIDWRKKLQQA